MLEASTSGAVVVGVTDSGGMRALPDFEVRGAIITRLPVFVMDLFAWLKETTKRLFHDKSVLGDRTIGSTVGMVGGIDHEVLVRTPRLALSFDLARMRCLGMRIPHTFLKRVTARPSAGTTIVSLGIRHRVSLEMALRSVGSFGRRSRQAAAAFARALRNLIGRGLVARPFEWMGYPRAMPRQKAWGTRPPMLPLQLYPFAAPALTKRRFGGHEINAVWNPTVVPSQKPRGRSVVGKNSTAPTLAITLSH